MSNKTKIFISLIFAVFLTGLAFSQEKPIIISTKVGEQIDAAERIKFGIIGGSFKDFQSAVFYRTSSRKYTVKIKFLNSANTERDTIIDTDENSVFTTALRVEFFNDLSKNRGPMNPKFSIDSTGDHYFVKISNVYPDKLPFAVTNGKHKNRYSEGGFGVSASRVWIDFSPVKNFFDAAENSFRQSGYTITPTNLNFDSPVMYAFDFYIRIYRTWGIDFEAGKSMGSDIDFWYSGGYISYHLELKKPGGVIPFAAVGAGKYSYYVEGIYNAPLEGGAYLEKISSGGGAVGLFVKTGIDIGPSTGTYYLPFCFNVFASYSHFPKVKSTDYGYDTKLNLGGIRLGAGLRFYF